jgi:hypothetical protein
MIIASPPIRFVMLACDRALTWRLSTHPVTAVPSHESV